MNLQEFTMSNASKSARKKINPKLKQLIEKMPEDRKLVLLKQLLKKRSYRRPARTHRRHAGG